MIFIIILVGVFSIFSWIIVLALCIQSSRISRWEEEYIVNNSLRVFRE